MITWDQVKAEKPEMIFYSCNTVWWTHDPKDLKRGPVPLDAFGSPLFESSKVSEFLNEDAVKGCAAYGKNPIETLMACHAQNIEKLIAIPGFNRRMQYGDVAKLLESREANDGKA